MLWSLVFGLVAGFFAGNGLPYYAEGSAGRTPNPSVFSTMPRTTTVNILLGCACFVVAGIAWHFAGASHHPLAAYGTGLVGMLLVGLIHARVWPRVS
jgi:hypothetical protein